MADWVTVRPGLPSSITAATQVLTSLIDALLAILEILRTVLDVVKAFAVGLLDPITAFVEALLAEIENLLQDIRQIGIYISGDLEFTWPDDNLLGGFQAYERRMIARLVDRTDSTRPNFTPSTRVVAVFLYQSFNESKYADAVTFMGQIKAFFGLRKGISPLPYPVGLTVSYGSTGTGVGAFGFLSDVLAEGGEPNVANVRWTFAVPPNSGAVAWPLPPPAGFIVEVSTVSDGFTLAYQTAAPNATVDAEAQQSRVFGLVSDTEGGPFHLYSADTMDFGDLSWSESGGVFTPPDGGDPMPSGKTRLYLYRSSADSVATPPNIVVGGKTLYQRTFFIAARSLRVAPGQPYTINLRYEDMPYDATVEDAEDGKVRVIPADEPARDVYVRVSSVTTNVKDNRTFHWVLDQQRITSGVQSGQVLIGLPEGVSSAWKGPPSAPLKVTFPGSRGPYLDTLTVALVIVVLSRSDLVPTEAEGVDPEFEPDVGFEATGLEDIARYVTPLVIGPNPGRFFKKQGMMPHAFRSQLLRRCQAAANRLIAETGPLLSSVEQLVLAQATVSIGGNTKTLTDMTWADLAPGFGTSDTILESLDTAGPGVVMANGVGLNPLQIGRDPTLMLNLIGFENDPFVLIDRKPGFLLKSLLDTFRASSSFPGKMGDGSADYSPVYYTVDRDVIKIRFVRNILLANPTVLAATAFVLNVAAAPVLRVPRPNDGAWTAVRLFPQGLPGADAALVEIQGFLRSIAAGTQGVADLIVAYIEFLQARILELEALSRRIQALLNATVSIQVPAASALVVSAAGTDGILQALVTAGNKPSDTSATSSFITADPDATPPTTRVVKTGAYGAGVVLVAGGLPSALAELLLLFFPEEE